MKISQKKSGVALTYATQIINIATKLVYTPVMLSIVGQSEYGLYQIADSIISYLALINLGVTGAYARYYTVAQEKDERSVKEVNGTFLTVLLLMSAVCVIAGLVLVWNVEALFGTGLTVDEYALSRKLMLVLIINMAITFPAGLFEHNITVNERFFTIKLINLLKTLLNPFIALPLLLLGHGSVSLVVTTTILTISATVIEMFYCITKLKMRFIISFKSFGMLKSIGKFTLFIFINQIIELINWNVDKILIARYMGSAAVAVYSVGSQIRSMFSSFPNAIRTVFQPRMYKMVAANESDERISAFFIKCGRIQCLILVPILIGFICIGKQFIVLWTGKDYLEAYYVALLIMIPIAVPHMQDLGIDLQRARNMHQARSVVYAVIAILNVALTIHLVPMYGIIGASTATGISLILGQGLFMNFYYKRFLRIDINRFWRTVLPIFAIEGLIGIAFYIICCFVNINTWIELIFAAACYVIVYAASVYMLFLTEDEKRSLLGMLNIRRKGN